jgi:hypothetical protein
MYYERLLTSNEQLPSQNSTETQASFLTGAARSHFTCSGMHSHAKSLQSGVTCKTNQAATHATVMPWFASLVHKFTTSHQLMTDSHYNFHIAFHFHHPLPSVHTATHPTTSPAMANFMDLPKAVREKIYRLHLVADEQPVDFRAYKRFCGYRSWGGDDDPATRLQNGETLKIPALLHVNSIIEQEASPIYYGENTFALTEPESLDVWKKFMFPRHLRHISKLVLLEWCSPMPGIANRAVLQLWKCFKLQSLTIMINEEDEVKKLLFGDVVFRCGGWSGVGPQINLQLLRLEGMHALKAVHGVQKLRFIKPGSAFDSEQAKDVGSLPGGLLESIKRDMVQRSLNHLPE